MPLTSRASPDPYDCILGTEGYLRPPDRILYGIFKEPWYKRESLPWFPERTQQRAISESLFPPQSETGISVVDRSGGFGTSDVLGGPDEEITVYAYTGRVDADFQGVDCSVPGLSIMGPKVAATSLTGQNAALSDSFEMTVSGTRYLFLIAGTKLYRSSDGVTFTNVQANGSDLPAVLTGKPAVFQGAQGQQQVYFPLGTGSVFRVWDGDTTHAMGTPTATDNNKVIDFLVRGGQLWAIWADTTNRQYRLNKCENGIPYTSAGASNPTWLPSMVVTDYSDPALRLMRLHDELLVGCAQSCQHPNDEDDDFTETLFWTPYSTTNFTYWYEWSGGEGELRFNLGQVTWRLRRQDGAFVRDIVGPDNLPSNRTPVQGPIYAKAGDEGCLYSFLKTSAGTVYLLKDRYYDGGRRMGSHVILQLGTYTSNYACVSNIAGYNVLYFGLSTAQIGSARLSATPLYPPGDSNYLYCDKGYLYDARMWGGMRFVTKVLLAWTGRAEALTSTETVTPYYRTAVSDSFTQFGSGSLSSDPGARIALSTPVSCAWWEGRLLLQRGSTTTLTPKLLGTTYHFALRPVAKGKFTLYLWITDMPVTRSGARDFRSARTVENTLIALDSTATPITLRNKRGLAYDVLVDDVSIFEVEDPEEHVPTAVARITAVEWAARGAGTHAALGAYTHGTLGGFTHGELSQLL